MTVNFETLPVFRPGEKKPTADEREKFVSFVRSFASFATERLIISIARPDAKDGAGAEGDVAALQAILGPKDIHRWNYLFKKGFELSDARNWIERRRHEQSRGEGLALLARKKDDGTVTSELHVDFDSNWLMADIGYATALGPSQRQGFATEAARGLIDQLLTAGLRHVVLTAAPDNLASKRVIERLGIPQVRGVTLEILGADGDIHLRHLFHKRVQ